MRDANWDPDFGVSAAKIEWFLTKEIDQSVDGVVAIDLSLAKDLLALTGPLTLSDFKMTVDDSNLYEKTQVEVEGDFFPGSRKKQTFLISLARELLTRLIDQNGFSQLALGQALFNNLEAKHILFSIHQPELQVALGTLGYTGSLEIPDCGIGCFVNWMGLADANLGANKANLYIKRSLNRSVSLFKSKNSETKVLSDKLEIDYTNSANPALGQNGIYKVYSRLLIPNYLNVDRVVTKDFSGQKDISFKIEDLRGIRQVGVYFEVPAGVKKTITFEVSGTNQTLATAKSLVSYFWKQPGTGGDGLTIQILTKGGSYRYNTDLLQDFSTKLILDTD